MMVILKKGVDVMNIKEKVYLLTHRKQVADLRRVVWVYGFVFVVWGLYRLIFRMPIWFEETVLKGLVFGGPVLWMVWREKAPSFALTSFGEAKGKVRKLEEVLESLGMRTGGLLAAVYLGVFMGLWLGVIGRVAWFVRTGEVVFNPGLSVTELSSLMLLGLVTAFWEELLFMGYMLPRVVKDVGSELVGVLVVATAFAALHVPVLVVEGVGLGQIIVRVLLLLTLSVANSILYLRFRNLAAPVFAHLIWGAAIYVFG